MTSLLISKELELISELDGNSYKMYRFITLTAGDKGYVYGLTREDLEKALNLGYTTTYKCLKELQKRGLIEYNGAKRFLKILPSL